MPLVKCEHQERIEPAGAYEIVTCRICGQKIRRWPNKPIRPEVIKLGRQGDKVVEPPEEHVLRLKDKDDTDLLFARMETNRAAGLPASTGNPVEKDIPPVDPPSDAPQSKSEGTPSETPGPEDDISQEIETDEEPLDLAPDPAGGEDEEPAEAPPAQRPARRKQTLEERLPGFLEKQEEVKADYSSMTRRDFLHKYHLSSNSWPKVAEKLNIQLKGQGHGGGRPRKNASRKSSAPKTPRRETGLGTADDIRDAKEAAAAAKAAVREMDALLAEFVQFAKKILETPALPGLPAFDSSWPHMVQVKWLEVWLDCYQKKTCPALQAHAIPFMAGGTNSDILSVLRTLGVNVVGGGQV